MLALSEGAGLVFSKLGLRPCWDLQSCGREIAMGGYLAADQAAKSRVEIGLVMKARRWPAWRRRRARALVATKARAHCAGCGGTRRSAARQTSWRQTQIGELRAGYPLAAQATAQRALVAQPHCPKHFGFFII